MKRSIVCVIAISIIVMPAWSTTFTKVADTNTAIPGGNGNFIEFSAGDEPAIDNGKVVFRGLGLDASSEQTDGIYTTLYGGLDVVADTDTQIPDADPGETFDTSDVHGFGAPTISGSNIAFKGDSEGASERGIYARFGANPLEVIADTRSSVFSTLSGPAISGSNIGYWTFWPASGHFTGVYEHTGGTGGSSHVIADEGDLVYGKNNPIRYYDDFYASAVEQDGNETAFIAQDTTGNVGLYSTITIGSLFAISPRVYSGDTAIPYSGGEYFDLQWTTSISFDDGDIVFRGQNTDQTFEGIYLYDTSAYSLYIVADLNTIVPGYAGAFTTFYDAAVDGQTNNVAFLGEDDIGVYGLFARINCQIGVILAEGDTLDGKIVEDIGLGHEGIDGTQVTFTVFFTDGSQGIYVADIAFPVLEPADLNGNGEVNIDDLSLMANNWLKSCPCILGDLDGDRKVNLLDFSPFASSWMTP